MILTRLLMASVFASTSAAAMARDLPHSEMVSRYVQDGKYAQVLTSCRGRQMTAPPNGSGHQLDCWAANVADDLRKQPSAITAFVLDNKARNAALSRCKALDIQERSRSDECALAARADSFVSLRLPRKVDTLKPVTFK